MAETSKNKIYYNDNENSIADVLTDMKKMAESTDEAIEKSKYDDTEIKNKDTEQDSKIEELQNQKTELEKELKEMQEDYYQTSIRGQASGEYIHVEDSSGARCKIGIYGNSEQETRSGKNLFKPLNITSNGITTTYDKDGVGTIKGTSTNMWANISANVIYLYPAGNYVLSIDEPKTFNINLKGIYTDEEIFEFVIPAGSKTKNVAFKKEVYSMYAFISGFAVGTTLDDTIKIQLEKGSTATDFEQYGVSPSPDYPSEIKTVGSNINLFNKDTATDGKYIDNNGSIQAETTAICSDYIEIETNKDYYISGRTNWGSIGIYDKSKTFLKRIATTQTNGIFNITNSNCKYIRVNASITDKDTLKIEKGSTPTSYSKYGQGSVKLTKCNKNLYNKNKEIICNGVGIGANGELFSRSDQKLLIIPISKEEKNIAVSFTKTFSYNLRYAFSNTIVENINSEIFDTDYIENSTTTNIKVNKIIQNNRHNYLLLGFTNKDNYPDLQVEYEKEVSPYEEHQEQSYIIPVQQEMLEDDYFDWDNEEEVHTWNKLVLTGDEAWVREATTSAGYRFFMNPSPSARFNNDAKKNVFCDKLNRKTANETWLGNEGISASRNIQIYLKEYSTKTLDEFKTWLKEHVLTVYYKLATPTRLKFTDDQKSVAKELNNARTYKNVTNITTDSKAILSLDYVKDLEKNKLEIYSTEEQVIGNLFGKPLYRKTVNYVNQINSNYWYDIDTIYNVDKVLDIKYSISSSDGSTTSINYVDTGSNVSKPLFILMNKTKNVLQVRSTNESWSKPDLIVTIEYTKTTD